MNLHNLKVFAMLIFCLSSCINQPPSEMISETDVQRIRAEARRQLEGCRLTAHDGTILYTPDGVGSYAALWTRDFCYMVENAAEFIQPEQIRAAINYLLNGQREDGCVPDRVQSDGLVVYSAGPVGRPLGDPPADNSQFIVKLVASYVAETGDFDYFRTHTCQLVAAMNYTRRSASGLVWIDPNTPQSPYGFTDTVAKTGDVLFSSLLYWQASRMVASLFRQIGDSTSAADFNQRARNIEMHLKNLWDETAGMFLAASHDCRQIDIWGNAFAIDINFPLGSKKDRIVDYLAPKSGSDCDARTDPALAGARALAKNADARCARNLSKWRVLGNGIRVDRCRARGEASRTHTSNSAGIDRGLSREWRVRMHQYRLRKNQPLCGQRCESVRCDKKNDGHIRQIESTRLFSISIRCFIQRNKCQFLIFKSDKTNLETNPCRKKLKSPCWAAARSPICIYPHFDCWKKPKSWPAPTLIAKWPRTLPEDTESKKYTPMPPKSREGR